MTAPPRYGTPRSPERRTNGRRIALVSEAIGAPLMPWQQLVADVATELDPDDPGAYWYKTVVVTVPRQAGKTTLLRAVHTERALARERARIFMTAQDGKTARRRWRDLRDALEASPLASAVRFRESQGSEAIRFINNSEISPFAPTPKNLHGETPPLVSVDEAWAFNEVDGAALMAAISPAQITLRDRQLWIVSTAGTAESALLNDLVDRGREAVSDPASRLAYFEWSADPEAAEADPYSDDTLSFHPALGITQRLDDLRAQGETESRGNWFRGYLNLRTGSADTVLDMAAWDALAREDLEVPDVQQLTAAYAVARDRSAASIWASWVDGEDVHLAMLASRPGAGWLADAVQHLAAGGARLVADGAGATRAVTEDLIARGVEVDQLTSADYATACEAFIGNVEDGHVIHDGDPELRRALEVAVLRPLGGARAFSAAASAGPIDTVQAACVAAHRAEHGAFTGVPIF